MNFSNVPIAKYRDRHVGQTAWLLGNGPSALNWTMAEIRHACWDYGGKTIGINRCWRKQNKVEPFHEGFQSTDYHCFVAGHHFDDWCAGRVLSKTAFVPVRLAHFITGGFTKYRGAGSWVPLPIIDQGWDSGINGRPFVWDFTGRTRVPSTFAGLTALQLAAFMGFSRIVLIGYDAHDNEGHFFDGGVPEVKGFKRAAMVLWFTEVAHWARESGVDVINANPASAITQLPTMTKEQVLRAVCNS